LGFGNSNVNPDGNNYRTDGYSVRCIADENPRVIIDASANPACSGEMVTFTATPTNEGTSPAYQWKVNNSNVGTNSATYTYTPANGDVVTCVMTPGAGATTSTPVTSNAITMTIGSCDANSFLPDASKYVAITVNEFNAAPPAAPIGTKTLTFLTYNLGADPNMTPKQQMAYPGCPTDMTVFGGWYQWGHKNPDHTFRCDYPTSDADKFTKTLVQASAFTSPSQFIYENIGILNDWVTPQMNNLWGNGLAIFGGGNNPATGSSYNGGSENPCPAGWRVPTQHEWALIGQENGNALVSNYDDFVFSGYAVLARSGIYWVKVSNGKAFNGTFSGTNTPMNGYALYKQAVWTAAADGYKDGTLSLTEADAPEPLLFLPAAGCRGTKGVRSLVGGDGYYWSSSIASDTLTALPSTAVE
jgi:hypothetical protein